MSLWLPEYEKVVVTSGHDGSVPREGDKPPRIIIHTTEGLRLYDYPWPPHFTIALVGHPLSLPPGRYWYPDGYRDHKAGDVVLLQHCDLSLTAYALKHSADIETNHMGRFCVQTEVVSKAMWGDDWDDEFRQFVADHHSRIINALEEYTGEEGLFDLDPMSPGFDGGAAYGATGSVRMTYDEWREFNGIAGHQHVPTNSHWDPGKLDRASFIQAVADGVGTVPDPIAEEMIRLERYLKRAERARRRLEKLL